MIPAAVLYESDMAPRIRWGIIGTGNIAKQLARGLAALPPAPDGLEDEAIDGKTLRGSRKQGAENVHWLRVV